MSEYLNKKKSKDNDQGNVSSIISASENRERAEKHAHALYDEAAHRRGKRNKYAEEKIQKEIQENKFKPTINKKSEKLVSCVFNSFRLLKEKLCQFINVIKKCC